VRCDSLAKIPTRSDGARVVDACGDVVLGDVGRACVCQALNEAPAAGGS